LTRQPIKTGNWKSTER